MANESTLPPNDQAALASIGLDQDQIEILLAGHIADDDMMWVVRCSIEELHRMFATPVVWVAALGKHPGWKLANSQLPAPTAVLTRDFVMLVRETRAAEPDGWVTVQGIGGTNALTVSASRASGLRSMMNMGKVAPAMAERIGASLEDAYALADVDLLDASDDPFADFWNEVAYDANNAPTYKKVFLVNVVLANSSFYGHLEILDPDETPEERAARTATFLLANALDPVGYAAMLNGLDQRTTYIDGNGSSTLGPPIRIAVPSRSTVVYGNVEDSGDDGGETGEEDDESTVCHLLNGEYYPPSLGGDEHGTGDPAGGMLKRYGGGDG